MLVTCADVNLLPMRVDGTHPEMRAKEKGRRCIPSSLNIQRASGPFNPL
tara:strand:- start:917 stop:1063 length:147 start_codon:yes stop_codon:yes gene_type:complete